MSFYEEKISDVLFRLALRQQFGLAVEAANPAAPFRVGYGA